MTSRHFGERVLAFLLLLAGSLFTAPAFGSDLFPEPPCIQPNISFWTAVYTVHPTTKGILHDSSNLAVVYAVIDLRHPDKHGAKKVNTKRIKAAKEKYKKILEGLAKGEGQDPESMQVARQFGPGVSPAVFRRAIANIRCQIGQSDRFQEGLARSGAYIDEMKAVFLAHGLPEDLAYIPHVESSFNLNAHSKVGAAGIWQFTRSTGRRLMKIGYALDERRDPIRSTEAAALLLKENYAKLGNWPMAITAYNHGMAGMRRAKRTKGSYEDIFTDYRSRRFRFASRNFYPEFLAARHVAKNYRQYFDELELDRPLATCDVALEGHASITDLSSHFDVDVQTLQALNPALRRPVLKAQAYVPKGYTLRLPADAVQNGCPVSSELMQALYKPHQKPGLVYEVKRGDTLGEIAREHNLRISDLIFANSLDTRGTIYVNQKLRLPSPNQMQGEKEDLRVTSIPNEPPLVD